MVHSIRGWMRGWQVKLCDPWKTCAIHERLCNGVGLHEVCSTFQCSDQKKTVPEMAYKVSSGTLSFYSLTWQIRVWLRRVPSTCINARDLLAVCSNVAVCISSSRTTSVKLVDKCDVLQAVHAGPGLTAVCDVQLSVVDSQFTRPDSKPAADPSNEHRPHLHRHDKLTVH